MGIDYNAVLAIGKEFNDRSEAQEFLEGSGVLSEDDLDDIENGDGLGEWLYNNDKVGGGILNYYSSCTPYYIGYDISVRDPEAFQKSFDDAMTQWNQLFPSVAPDVIHTVRVS